MARIHNHAEPFEIPVDTLGGKTVAVDAYLMLYKHIKAKRGHRGKAITNADGEEIAHIQGAWNHAAFYLENQLTPVYVFEGGIPDLKVEEHKRRKAKAEEAKKNYEQAKAEGDEEAMEKWGARADTLEYDQVDEVKELFELMGVPVVESPSEADPQCGQLSKEGQVDYVHTEDFDHLLHGVDGLLRRFNNGVGELVSRQQILDELDYTHEQLVWRQIVAGCDYNNSPKQVAWGRAGGIIEGCETFEEVIDSTYEYCEGRDELKWDADRWRKVWNWFENPNVKEGVDISSDVLSVRDTKDFLVHQHGLDGRQVQSRLRDIVDG